MESGQVQRGPEAHRTDSEQGSGNVWRLLHCAGIPRCAAIAVIGLVGVGHLGSRAIWLGKPTLEAWLWHHVPIGKALQQHRCTASCYDLQEFNAVLVLMHGCPWVHAGFISGVHLWLVKVVNLSEPDSIFIGVCRGCMPLDQDPQDLRDRCARVEGAGCSSGL